LLLLIFRWDFGSVPVVSYFFILILFLYLVRTKSIRTYLLKCMSQIECLNIVYVGYDNVLPTISLWVNSITG